MSNSRDIILQNALTLFSQKGYEGVGISEIVSVSGITKPTLYYFFQSKEGVLKAILENYYTKLVNEVEACSNYTFSNDYYSDVYPVLLKVVNTYINFALNNKEFYKILLALSYAPDFALPAAIAECYQKQEFKTIETMFKTILSFHGNLKGKEKELTISFLSIINGYIKLALNEAYQVDSAMIVHQFMHGIF